MEYELRKVLEELNNNNNDTSVDDAYLKIIEYVNNNFVRTETKIHDFEGLFSKIETAFIAGKLHICPVCGEITNIHCEKADNWLTYKQKCSSCEWIGYMKETNSKSIKDSVIELIIKEFLF